MNRRHLLRTLGGAGLASGSAGCLEQMLAGNSDGTAASEGDLAVAVTTSLYDTGLPDELHAAFQERYGIQVASIAGGTGQNLRLGETGDVDVVTAHAPELEAEFLQSGHGINRRDFAFGDFVVLGSPDDPANVADVDTARAAFERIAETKAPFLSRGDSSGTYRKEREIWSNTNVNPDGEWYAESGQGMGETIVQADQQDAYLLAVRGTYLAMADRIELSVLVDGPITGGDPTLANPYGVIPVNPAIHSNVNYEHAMLYVGYLTGNHGQEIIGNYTVDGEQLFFANALTETPNFEQYLPANQSQK